jgi:hypothetical protein
MMKSVCSKMALVAVLGVVTVLQVSAADKISLFNDTLSIGGENRLRAEAFSDFYTANGLSDLDDSRLLMRNRLHIDYHPNDYFGAFAEVMDSREFGSDIISRAPANNLFEDDFDLFLAYIDVKNIGDSPVSVRIGRQILAYGKQRLIGHLLWVNTGRAFDAAKVTVKLEDYGGTLDFFYAEPVNRTWGEFNDFLDNDNDLFGVYTVWNKVEYVGFIEPYVIHKHNDTADIDITTFGLRTGNTYESGWDWEFEGAGQVGEIGPSDQASFAIHGEAGYTFKETMWSPRVALGYDFSPGDEDPTDGDIDTFDNLYPTNHMHYGQMDLFSWQNAHQIEIDLSAKPMDQVNVFAEAHFIFLDETTDAWYNAGSGVIRRAAPGTNPDDYVGTEIDLRANYKPSDWFMVEVGYSHFFAGDYVSDTGQDDDADWGYLMTTITF